MKEKKQQDKVLKDKMLLKGLSWASLGMAVAKLILTKTKAFDEVVI